MRQVYTHYKGLTLSNVWAEELVKEFKNLSAQARAHAASAEIRILLHQRRVRGRRYFELPTRERLRRIRRKLGHHLRRRARRKREPPAEPLPAVVWDVHDGSAEDEDEGWEEGEAAEAQDIDKCTVAELKSRLKAVGASGYSKLRKPALADMLRTELGDAEAQATLEAQVEAEDDDGEPEEDEEELTDADDEVRSLTGGIEHSSAGPGQ